MTTTGLARPWADVFFRLMQTHAVAAGLKEAALSASLGVWTERLTSLMVATCEALGWRPAAKGHLGDVLPLVRQEYLALDVMAFRIGGATRWPFPIAVFELNATDYPRSANVYDSLGEAYMLAGRREPAIRNYRK
jgi:hypothetical protein